MPVLTGWAAILAAVAVVVAVIVFWKLLKFAFKIALLVAAGVLAFYGLKWAGVL